MKKAFFILSSLLLFAGMLADNTAEAWQINGKCRGHKFKGVDEHGRSFRGNFDELTGRLHIFDSETKTLYTGSCHGGELSVSNQISGEASSGLCRCQSQKDWGNN